MPDDTWDSPDIEVRPDSHVEIHAQLVGDNLVITMPASLLRVVNPVFFHAKLTEMHCLLVEARRNQKPGTKPHAHRP